MQFKFFWEKVDVDVQRKDQQCYWSSFVCMAAIDKAEVPHFQRKYNKLQIATSTGRLISNWFFEIIDLWPLVEADIESILLPVVLWENWSDGERMVRMRMRMVREWVGWWARSRRRSCRRSLSVNSCQPAWDQLRVNCSCEYSIECRQLTIDQSNDIKTVKKSEIVYKNIANCTVDQKYLSLDYSLTIWTKLQPQNLDQTSASKFQPSFDIKVSTKLELKNLDQA